MDGLLTNAGVCPWLAGPVERQSWGTGVNTHDLLTQRGDTHPSGSFTLSSSPSQRTCPVADQPSASLSPSCLLLLGFAPLCAADALLGQRQLCSHHVSC